MRFFGFEKPWVKIRCDEFLKTFSTNSLSWDNLTYDDNQGLLNIHYGLIHNGAPTLIDTNTYKLPKIKNYLPSKYELIKDGDIIFTDASEDTKEIFKPIEMICIGNNKVVAGLHTIHARDFKKLTIIGFKAYLFSSSSIRNQVIKITQGTKIYSMNSGNLKEINAYIPDNLEQQKIVNLLSKIDARINTQSKIIEEINSFIIRCSHDYFKKIDVPKVFLSELAEIYQPQTISQSKCKKNGKYKVFGANGIIGMYDNYNHTLEQICITCRGSTSGNVFISDCNSWITGNAMVINVDKNLKHINKTYLYYYLKNYNYKNIISGSGQPQIVKEPLLKLQIKLPDINEQIKFERFIKSINSKLTIEKDILEMLKKQKVYLLKNLFI